MEIFLTILWMITLGLAFLTIYKMGELSGWMKANAEFVEWLEELKEKYEKAAKSKKGTK